MEPDGSAQVAVFVDFENLVLGAVKELPDQANPAPYEALTRLCRGYGNASVRRAYADWANTRFGAHQEDLAMNGVDLIQVARVGIQNKNAADIRMAVDAMETLIVHPDISVFVLVSGDGDYSPLVQRLREFGKWVVGVGTEANASRKLVSVCSEYKYWGTLVAEVEPEVRPAGLRGVQRRDADGRRPEEQDAGTGRGLRRAQLRMPELPGVPGFAAAPRADRRNRRPRHCRQADRRTAQAGQDEKPQVLGALEWADREGRRGVASSQR
jgi:uncharacterized LabA/DUF88 family protein